MRQVVFGVPALGEELDYAGGRVGAEERAFRPAHDFHAGEPGGGEAGQVDLAAGIVHRDAIDQQQHGRGLAAPVVHGGQAARPAAASHLQSRNLAQHVAEWRVALRQQVVGSDHGGGGAGFLDRGFAPGRRNDHALAAAFEGELDARRRVGNQIDLFCFKARGRNGGPAGAGLGQRKMPVGAGFSRAARTRNARARNRPSGRIEYHPLGGAGHGRGEEEKGNERLDVPHETFSHETFFSSARNRSPDSRQRLEPVCQGCAAFPLDAVTVAASFCRSQLRGSGGISPPSRAFLASW